MSFPIKRSSMIRGLILLVLVSTVSGGGIFLYQKQVGAQGYYYPSEPDSAVHGIQLTDQGFDPSELVVRQGDKVIFNSAIIKPFWPEVKSSGNTGTYPEFNSKGPINPPENWELIFNNPGVWKYQDRLDPSKTGTIVVLTEQQITANLAKQKPSLTACLKFTDYKKQQCWNLQLDIALRTEGLEAAFDFFVKLYNTEPDVPKACHEWGHSLGKEAYAEYKQTGKLVIRPEASYCGYGYFHSFIEQMVKDTGEFDGAIQFCKDAVTVLEGKLDPQAVHDNCVHGVGHGTTAWLLEQPDNWGNFQKVVDQGTAVCEKLFTTDSDLQNCYDGVFNELHLDLFNDQYGLSFEDFMKKDDPFWLCQEQKDAYKRTCYFEFVGIFWKIFDMDLSKAMQYVVTHIDDLPVRGPSVVSKISGDWIQFDIVNDSNERNIQACRDIPSFLFDSCVQGIANGFIQHGNPADLHDRAFKFCNANYLTEQEHTLCFSHFLGILKSHYTPMQFAQACSLVETKYQIDDCKSALQKQ